MITKILQYYRGFVIVRIISHSPERFLNLCRNHEIVLQDLTYRDGYYECQMDLKDFRRIRSIAHKSHTRLFIVKKCGFPFFLYRNRHRKVTYIVVPYLLLFYILCLYLYGTFSLREIKSIPMMY